MPSTRSSPRPSAPGTASEAVAETYYSLQLAKGIFVTADYQFLSNPAYNAVRGPAHIFSGRLLARF